MDEQLWIKLHADRLLLQFISETGNYTSHSTDPTLAPWIYGSLETTMFEPGHPPNADAKIYKRVLRLKFDYIISLSTLTSPASVPVSKELEIQDLEMVSLDRSALSFCLHFVNNSFSKAWIHWQDPDSEVDCESFVPQLYLRRDSTESQKNSLVQILSFQVTSQQLAGEIGVQEFLGSFFRDAMGEESRLWRSLYTHDNSPALEGTPFCVFLQEQSCGNGKDRKSKEGTENIHAAVARALHPTMLLFLSHHYQSNGWDAERALSASDMDVSLDERLFAISVSYTNKTLSFFAHFPTMTQLGGGRYGWQLRYEHTETFTLSSPLLMRERLLIFNAILAVEQQVYVLGRLFPFLVQDFGSRAC
ncbi:hypothetical protein OBBRIDRAFT_789759 [Obba rivulosa]|uniref:Uncharacterized protein n=1 Tax=Obba rivulosa TaxID=1052685 RepID=A0A8E2DQL4_9APHY|nr:hypothetical protein OBBRIDRAFT_789759 [Obba rivulosa]